jgi:ABC-2 type transport system ATP-binding protein
VPALIEVHDLAKTYKTGLFRRSAVEAVKGISFSVAKGAIVGFLGPNGSGKTTTIKMLLGLIAPTRGTATMFGERLPSVRARKNVGFLPENPYVYPYLTPRELVEMNGRLSGMGRELRKRTEEVLDATGVLYAADRQARRLSKGMLQRSALAAALVAAPELLILDEPMSGLDPVGRKEVREIIVRERDAGRTIFFSTHILSDVEALCDEVIILRSGRVEVSGAIRELLSGDVIGTDITLAAAGAALEAELRDAGYAMTQRPGVVVVSVTGDKAVRDVLGRALAAQAEVVEVVPHRETLEDLFMRRAIHAPQETAPAEEPAAAD